MKYGTIMADPPWAFTFSTRKREDGLVGWRGSAGKHYPTMTEAAIRGLPVSELALPDSVLWLWACNSQMRQALRVMEAWGFEFKNVLTWAKVTKAGQPAIGMGYWLRGATEHLLLGVRGRPKPLVRNLPTWFSAPVGRHSEKPDEAYRMVELLSPGPRVELFARRLRNGWDRWGNEIESNVSIETETP